MITAEKNRRRGKTNSVQTDTDEHIEWLKKRFKDIESQISSAIAINEDSKQKMKAREGEVASLSLITLLDLLTSVPGIDERPRVVLRRRANARVGEVVAVTLIFSLPELGTISHKSISYLVGVAPFNRNSGKFRGKRKIWGGRAKIHCSKRYRYASVLYMATLVVMRFNPVIKAFYERLVNKGKLKKVAIIAWMQRLLIILNATIENNLSWKPQITD